MAGLKRSQRGNALLSKMSILGLQRWIWINLDYLNTVFSTNTTSMNMFGHDAFAKQTKTKHSMLSQTPHTTV